MLHGSNRKVLAFVSAAGLSLLAIAGAARAEPDAKLIRTWKAKCATCHSATGDGKTEQGVKQGIPDFSTKAWQAKKTDADIKTAISEGVKKDGKEGMDPFKDKLTPEQIDGMLAVVRSLAK